MKKKMARAYVVLLFATEILILAATLILHVRAWLGTAIPYSHFARLLPLAGFMTAIVTGFLAADRIGFKTQLKSNPKWVRIAIWAALIYAPIAALFHSVLYTNGSNDPENLFVVSLVTLALSALSLGILQSVLWSDPLEEPELIERSRNSCIAAILLCGYIAARHAGFLAPQHRVEVP
jgi:hypothetical protein